MEQQQLEAAGSGRARSAEMAQFSQSLRQHGQKPRMDFIHDDDTDDDDEDEVVKEQEVDSDFDESESDGSQEGAKMVAVSSDSESDSDDDLLGGRHKEWVELAAGC